MSKNGDGELITKRVVFPMAGKGGVGKTTVMVALAEWYRGQGVKAQLVDMDPDNKAEGCLKAFFADALKLPALEKWAYDRLGGLSVESDGDIILTDFAAAQGHELIPWFREFYREMQLSGVPLRWTAVGVVTSDIASARTVLEWGEALQANVDYLIVHNFQANGNDPHSAWNDAAISEAVKAFRESFKPMEIMMEARRPDLQNLMRKNCVTLEMVGARKTSVPELDLPEMAFRARIYLHRIFDEFRKTGEILLP